MAIAGRFAPLPRCRRAGWSCGSGASARQLARECSSLGYAPLPREVADAQAAGLKAKPQQESR